MTFTLPVPARRVWVRAFWLSLMLMAGAALAVARLLTGPSLVWLWGGVAVLVLLAVGEVRSSVRDFFYRVWARGASKYCRLTSRLITRLCFWIIAVAAPAGSRMRMQPSDVCAGECPTGWIRRIPANPSHYGSQHLHDGSGDGWLSSTSSWARHTHNLWFVALVPYIAILRRVERRQVRSLGGNIYTLY